MKYILTLLTLLLISTNYDPPSFDSRINLGEIANDNIDEASGIAASKKYNNIFWIHNDSGNENKIFAVGNDGSDKGTFVLKNITNRDWEDIAVGPGPIQNESYIYLADIGDNSAEYPVKYIYRLKEPELSNNPDSLIEIDDIAVIQFLYPDGERDAETLMIDPITKDLYIVGKRDSDIRVYRLPYPQNTAGYSAIEVALKFNLLPDPESNVPENYVTAGDISRDGSEILIKSYSNIFYWWRDTSNSIISALQNEPVMLPYVQEPQGEAICWQNTGVNGYYTVSEENINIGGLNITFPAMLYYYPRQISTGINNQVVIKNYNLYQNYPNPFNPSTTIEYSIPQNKNNGLVSVYLSVYDLLGNKIKTLVNSRQKSGQYKINFNGSNLSSGIYYYKIVAGTYHNAKKMLLLK